MPRRTREHVEGTTGAFRRAVARAAKGAWASRFAKPIAQAALAVAGLLALAFVGRSAAGSGNSPPVPAASSPAVPLLAPPPAEPGSQGAAGGPHAEGPAASPAPIAAAPTSGAATDPPAPPRVQPPARAGAATPEDPVILNSATEADLRRLSGIGAKRADAILALRARLGRFRAIEDLLKVRGIGRATLRRLRPMLRLDAPHDAGPPQAVTSPSP